MSIKSTAVKNYINDIGVNTQVFVFAGSDPNLENSNTSQSAINLWNYSDFAVRVGKNSIVAVVPYIKWFAKKPYKPWSSTQINTGNFYAYNDQNGYVYLCISDNVNNRSDSYGTHISNVRPTHTSGIQRYNDGYAWKPLYKITPSFHRFVTSNWIPVISFDTFDDSPKISQLKMTQNFCTQVNNTGVCGSCGIYAKLPLSTDDDTGTIEYSKGDLFTVTQNITCSDCHYLMYNNNKFKSVFYGDGQTVPTSIEILDNYELVGSLIESNEVSQSSPYYYLYDINQNDNLDEGSIVSAFIDLSQFSAEQLITTVPDPEFTIISNSGINGKIKLKTGLYQNKYIIVGIEVVSPGSFYKDIRLSIDSSILSVDSAALLAAINVNLDTIDGLGFDPISILGAEHVMIDSRIEKQLIESSEIFLPDSLNFFGMVENPISTVDLSNSNANTYISGSDQNIKDDIIYRTTIQARITNPTSSKLPAKGDKFSLNNATLSTAVIEDSRIKTSVTRDMLIGGISPISTTQTKAEIKNVLYAKYPYLIGVTMDGSENTTNKDNNTITQITGTPQFVQYSGKPVSTKKLNTDLNLSELDSVIIRINMIKGM